VPPLHVLAMIQSDLCKSSAAYMHARRHRNQEPGGATGRAEGMGGAKDSLPCAGRGDDVEPAAMVDEVEGLLGEVMPRRSVPGLEPAVQVAQEVHAQKEERHNDAHNERQVQFRRATRACSHFTASAAASRDNLLRHGLGWYFAGKVGGS
jgi:hypothetical protein